MQPRQAKIEKEMTGMKNIFVINGSASENSANKMLVNSFAKQTKNSFDLVIFASLKTLPHFDPDLSVDNTPEVVLNFRDKVQNADGILICTPEYVFSIPSGLKNALEWCVSTTVFSDKPTGLITASASGQKGQEELQLIMGTLMAKLTNETTLLIQGVRGKLNREGEINDDQTREDFANFIEAFEKLVGEASS